jgi:tRNA A-37 threonylcarbamoyl transferase component Bud32
MAFLEINPAYRELLDRSGLRSLNDFLGLPAVIISGHPDRHVGRIRFQDGAATVTGFLKREHRIPWRDRLANAVRGLGFTSKSYREAVLLRALRHDGVGCPEWIAVGEDGNGRAFLLVRELADHVELRTLLCQANSSARQQLAQLAGRAVARFHAAGFDHRDLYSKHVHVDAVRGVISFLDWQRARQRRHVSWRDRCRDIAALHATLTPDLATPRERLRFLWTYLRALVNDRRALRTQWRQVILSIHAEERVLLRRRHVAQTRQISQPLGTHGILWLDGEALCVTEEFWRELGERVPRGLLMGQPGIHRLESRRIIQLPDGRAGLLVCRRRTNPLRWLWSKLRGRRLVSPEVRQAGVLFRRQISGETGPRVLAFGQRQRRPWQTDSFLLTETATENGGTA